MHLRLVVGFIVCELVVFRHCFLEEEVVDWRGDKVREDVCLIASERHCYDVVHGVVLGRDLWSVVYIGVCHHGCIIRAYVGGVRGWVFFRVLITSA